MRKDSESLGQIIRFGRFEFYKIAGYEPAFVLAHTRAIAGIIKLKLNTNFLSCFKHYYRERKKNS